jgi:hypothetical protein
MQANTIPATFWGLAFLLLPDNQDHKQQILLALQSSQSHAKHTGAPDAQAQQQTSPDGKVPAAVGGSADVAERMAAAAPGSEVAAHTQVPAAKGPEAAISKTAAPASDMQTAPPDARGPCSKGCLSLNFEFISDLSEQCGQQSLFVLSNQVYLSCASVKFLLLLLSHASSCCYKCQQICSCLDQTLVAFVHADITSIHTISRVATMPF